MRPAVLVTGASSGIGRACAIRLSESGLRVFAGVRTERSVMELKSLGRPDLEPLNFDLTNQAEVARAAATLRKELAVTGLAGLVNNAGICVTGPMEHLSLADFRRQLEVNVVGQLALTQAVLPLLKIARGRIVNMGSTSGRIVSRFAGPYCVAKFATEALSGAMRLELHSSGVRVSIIEPGVVATPFWRKVSEAEESILRFLPADDVSSYATALEQRRQRLRHFEKRGQPVEVVCRAILHALTARQPKLRYIVGRDAKMRIAIAKVLPETLWYRLAARKSR